MPLPLIHSHAAYFFVPLPQPLPFVDKQAIPIADMTPAGATGARKATTSQRGRRRPSTRAGR